MTTLFLNSGPKISRSNIFGPKFMDFSFCTKLSNNAIRRIPGHQFPIWKHSFQNRSPNHPNKVLFVLELRNSFSDKNLLSENFKDVDFKYVNDFLKF